MYKNAHEFTQRKADALNPKNYMVGELVLTDDEKRESIVLAIRKIEEQIAGIPKGKYDPRVKEWGVKIRDLQQELSKSKIKYPPDFPHYFMQIAKEMLTRPHFALLIKKAEWKFKAEEEMRRRGGKKDGLAFHQLNEEDKHSELNALAILDAQEAKKKDAQQKMEAAIERFTVGKKAKTRENSGQFSTAITR